MALNQMIAQGAQFNMPDPVAQYAKMQQLQTAQNQNALAQYQLSSTQRGDMQQNALYKRLQDPNFSQENPEHLASLAQFGTPGIQAMKAITDAKNAALTGSKTQGDILKQKTDHVNQMKRDLSAHPSNAQIDAYIEDLNTSGFYKPNEIAAATKHLSGLKDMPLEQRKALLAGAGATAGDLARSNRPIAVGGSLMSPTGGLIATAPAGPIKPPEKLEVMKALGYSMDAAGDAAYEAAKRAPPAAAAVPADVATMQTLGIPATPEGYVYFQALKAKDEKPTDLVRNYEYAKKQGFKGSLFDYERNLKEAGRAPAQPPRTQQLTLSDGSVVLVNMDTGVTTPVTLGGAGVKGKLSATAEKTAIQRKQLGLDLNRAITELTDVIKEGGLIDQSTGSGAGRLVDLAAGFGGQAMPGAIAIGKLQPIADLALKMVPRFEGPQSNADTTSYKQAAGQLADATLPREIRKEAAKTVLRLMKSRKDQFASPEMAAEGVASDAPPAPARTQSGATTSNW